MNSERVTEELIDRGISRQPLNPFWWCMGTANRVETDAMRCNACYSAMLAILQCSLFSSFDLPLTKCFVRHLPKPHQCWTAGPSFMYTPIQQSPSLWRRITLYSVAPILTAYWTVKRRSIVNQNRWKQSQLINFVLAGCDQFFSLVLDPQGVITVYGWTLNRRILVANFDTATPPSPLLLWRELGLKK